MKGQFKLHLETDVTKADNQIEKQTKDTNVQFTEKELGMALKRMESYSISFTGEM
jgi:hypothetical protein